MQTLKLAVVNRKGGAGKTTLAVSLAVALADRVAVTLIDADPQRSASIWIGGGEQQGVAVVLAGDAVTLSLELAKSRPGVVVVDCPPFDAEITQVALDHADLVLVPVAPSPLDLEAAAPLLRALATGARRGLAVLTMADTRTVLYRDALDWLRARGVPVATVSVGRRVAFAEASIAHMGVTDYDHGAAAVETRLLAAEVAERMGVR
jgi:chromosome partitioning protein